MDWNLLIALLLFLIPYVFSRQMSAAALGELPDEKKLELINVAVRGRKYLWLCLLPIVIALVAFGDAFYPVAAAVLLGMVTYNHWWIRTHGFPERYVRKHLHASLLAVVAILAPAVYFFGFLAIAA
jgi:hypothetical protein